jgi:hypothetical protein
VKVWTRPQHDVIIQHDLPVIALTGALPEPIADLARLDVHRCL